ncbi:endonuclease MutS2 [Robiginitalea sp. IMCC43444]|uniref:endonuclease MutS2 n=1 Tax=Robiginitalea sp. IMCC43444 TaxID=3459121 RepID=UPI004041C07C
MKQLPKKTIEDLEFPTVLAQLAELCHTQPGKERALELSPFKEHGELMDSLGRTQEYRSSYENENRIPNHGFESIQEALKLLPVENILLPVEAFRKVGSLCRLFQTHQKFFRKFHEYYPLLHQWMEQEVFIPEIPEQIEAVIDRFGEIRNDASAELAQIRRGINQLRGKINQSFNAALSRYQQADFLDDIRESVIENRRVLAVKAMHKRKVRGSVLGQSKTGSIVYIEPEVSLAQSRELQMLELEEQEEIRRILKGLAVAIRPYKETLALYEKLMTEVDLTAAKAGYAKSMDACLPDINTEKRMYLREAYHPLLLLNNNARGEKTWPQTIELHPENRIIVISGPNAGGKSITLKTIGLLQLMLQSGLLVPVHERSSCCLFDLVLTDIGDNQSIENHLSTYSYRLKNMNRFLRKCNAETLFLIDEFGTGSDPELGGALAETFLETFYEREAFGVITTHYANLKVLANELPYATNANMLFNRETLEPAFILEMGQPGSSFTFEVAHKNGIPYSLVNRAKKKVARGKVRFDATIAKLQKERSKMAQTGSRLQEEEIKAREEAQRLEELNSKIKDKLSNYQELYDYNQRMIHLGSKVDKAAESYFVHKKKRPLISELLRIVETENSKRIKKSAAQRKEEQQKKNEVVREAQEKVKDIRQQKKKQAAKKANKEKEKPRPVLKVGDRVRLWDGKAVGSIDSIEKNKAIVNYGLFTTNVGLDQLELVEKKGK